MATTSVYYFRMQRDRQVIASYRRWRPFAGFPSGQDGQSCTGSEARQRNRDTIRKKSRRHERASLFRDEVGLTSTTSLVFSRVIS